MYVKHLSHSGKTICESLSFCDASYNIILTAITNTTAKIRRFYTTFTRSWFSHYKLTVAPSLIDMGLDFFPIWLLMLKPILETFRGAGESAEDSSSSSGVTCWDVRLTAVPSPPTVLQETGLVFTLPSSSCGPAWGKTTHQGEQQFPVNWRIITQFWQMSHSMPQFISAYSYANTSIHLIVSILHIAGTVHVQ